MLKRLNRQNYYLIDLITKQHVIIMIDLKY